MISKYTQFIVLFISFSFQLVQAAELEQFFRAFNGNRAVVYAQSKSMQVKVYRMDQQNWPQLIDQKRFENRITAVSYLTQNAFVMDQSIALENLKNWNEELKFQTQDITATSVVLWKAEHQWSWDWELKYAQWLQTEVDVDFFEKYKVRTDCADVQYYVRWIFSRIHKLPMASRLPGGRYLTQNSMTPEWEKLATHANWYQDKRFLKAMEYLTGLVYTHTLYRDAYPVELSQTALLPGAFHLTLGETSGHTMVIYRQQPASSGVRAYVMSSTVPRKVRRLSSHRISSYRYAANKSALLRMRWPLFANGQVSLIAPNKMPYFSEQQFAGEVDVNRILNPNPDWEVEYNDLLQTLQELLNQRVGLVEEGLKVCYPNKCDPAGKDWDIHSTPSRDRRIKETFTYLHEELPREYKKFNERYNNEIAFTLNGEGFSLASIAMVFAHNVVSSDPNHSIDRRWPLGPTRFMNSMESNATDILKARREKIKKSNDICRDKKRCISGSEENKELRTENEVSNFYNLQWLSQSYSAFYPNDTEKFNIQNLQLSDGLKIQSYSEWKSILRTSISDPRGKAHHKEGQYDDLFVRIHVGPDYGINEGFSNGLVLLYNYETAQFKMVKAAGTTVSDYYFISDLESIHFVDSSQKITIVGDEKAIAVFDLKKLEKVFDVPNDLIKNRKILKYQSPFILLADDDELMTKYGVYKNIKIYDLSRKNYIFQAAPELILGNVGISKLTDQFHYSTMKINTETNEADYIAGFVVTMSDPNLFPQPLDSLSLAHHENNYIFKNEKLFRSIGDLMQLSNLKGELIDSQQGAFGTDYQLLQIEESKTNPERYVFSIVELDQNTMELRKTPIDSLNLLTLDYTGTFDEALYVFSNINGKMYRFFRENQKIKFETRSFAETKVQQIDSCQLFFKYDQKEMFFQLRDVETGFKSAWKKNAFEIQPKFHDKSKGCWVENVSEQYDNQYYLSDNLELPILNYFFNIYSNGIVTNGQEIWLLR